MARLLTLEDILRGAKKIYREEGDIYINLSCRQTWLTKRVASGLLGNEIDLYSSWYGVYDRKNFFNIPESYKPKIKTLKNLANTRLSDIIELLESAVKEYNEAR